MGRVMLMTKALRKQIPKLYAQENVKDPWVYAKFFMPGTNYRIYVLEFDGEDRMFTYVTGQFAELGYSSLREISQVKNRLGLYMERDRYFTKTRLSKIKSGEVY